MSDILMNREIDGYSFTQRTSDGKCDGNSLLLSWKSVNGKELEKKMNHFLDLDGTKTFISELETQNRNLLNISAEEKYLTDYQVVIEQKGRKSKTGQTANKTWMEPELFVKLACWVNTKLEVKAMRLVFDELVDFREKSKNLTKELNSFMYQFGATQDNYSELSRALNLVVYNNHYTGIRNDGTTDQTKEMYDLQNYIVNLINDGLITDIEGIISLLEKKYMLKQPSFRDKIKKSSK